MPAKRVVAMLCVQDGRIVAPEDGADLGAPIQWARRLEMEGADEVLFVERGAPAARRPWLAAVAGGLFIPFALEAAFKSAEALAGALEDGADRVVVAAPRARELQAERFGRARVVASLDAVAGEAWRVALEAMADVDPGRGGGDTPAGRDRGPRQALCRQTVRLPMPVLFQCSDPTLAVGALAHGADGVVIRRACGPRPSSRRCCSPRESRCGARLQPGGCPSRRHGPAGRRRRAFLGSWRGPCQGHDAPRSHAEPTPPCGRQNIR